MQGASSKVKISPSLVVCGLLGFVSAVWSSDTFTTTTYVRKGGNFTLMCQVSGRGVHMWHKDGRVILPDANNRFHLEDSPPFFSRETRERFTLLKLKVQEADKIHSGVYKCNSNFSQRVIVITENMIQTNEDEPGLGKLLIPDETLVLHCNTTECAHCLVVWFKNGQPLEPIKNHLEIHSNNTVVIKHANYGDTGVYLCAIDRNQLDVALNATIVVQSVIKLDKFEASSTAVEGGPLELHCGAKGAPTPIIKWFVGDREIFEDDERIMLLEHEGLKKGKLLIEEAEYSDRNHYTCEAFNQIETVNTTVFIRIRDKLAALWPFLGICAEVIILCSIIFVYERRKAMSQCNEQDTDLPAEKQPRDQMTREKDVRQRRS